MTVAFEIRRPWPTKKSLLGGAPYYPSLVTIWHVDPETDGTDDSCDWFHRDLSEAERRAARDLITNDLDNLNGFFGPSDPDDKDLIMLAQWRVARSFYRPRPWYRHPRWHVRHWKIQVHFTQKLKRYLFSRCAGCGQRFPWGYAPIGPWHGGGPRWFRSEESVYHHGCDRRATVRQS